MKKKQNKKRGQRKIKRWSYTNDAEECNACEISLFEQFTSGGIGVCATTVASEVPAVPVEALPEPLNTWWFWTRPICRFIRRFVLWISMPHFFPCSNTVRKSNNIQRDKDSWLGSNKVSTLCLVVSGKKVHVCLTGDCGPGPARPRRIFLHGKV